MNKMGQIIVIAGLVLAIVYLTLLKLKPMVVIKLAFKDALKDFPREIVENAERLFRLETNHFKSGQFKGTYSPGMEKFAESFPYGWNTINKVVWSKYPQFKPVGFKTYTENQTGKQKTFLRFPSVKAAVYTVCGFLQHYGNNPGRWYSTKTESQQRYNASIVKFKPIFTNEGIT